MTPAGSRPQWREFLSNSFKRVTSSVAFIPQIDGLRALAVLLTIGHHVFAVYLLETHRLGTNDLPQDWNLILPRSPLVLWALNLTFGISIFFVISGFVLALPFARSGLDRKPMPSIPLYLLRRLIRLEPPYVISMTFLFALVVLPYHQPPWFFHVQTTIWGPHYLATLVYLHALIFKGPSWVNGVAWTLEIEVQFYLLMPLIAQLFRVRSATMRRSLFAALLLGTSLFGQYGVPHLHDPRWALSILGNMEFFAAGILLADIYVDPPRTLRLGPALTDCVAAAAASLVVYILHWHRDFLWVEPTLLLVFFLGVFHGRWASRLFSLRALTIPGTMCYTIYLYHVFIIQHTMPTVLRLFPTQHALWFDESLQMILMLVPILLVSAILYLTTERPFVILSHIATRHWRPKNVPPVVGA